MALLISIICFQPLPLFLVTLSHICPHAVFAMIPQSVFALTILAKLTLIFPLFAFGALLHLCPSSLVSHSRPPLDTLLTLAGFVF